MRTKRGGVRGVVIGVVGVVGWVGLWVENIIAARLKNRKMIVRKQRMSFVEGVGDFMISPFNR